MFSHLLSGSAQAFVKGDIPRILANALTIYKAVQAATSLLNPLFADTEAEMRSIERLEAVKQGNQRFGLFYLEWLATRTALPPDTIRWPIRLDGGR